jgi:hypothetical protein
MEKLQKLSNVLSECKNRLLHENFNDDGDKWFDKIVKMKKDEKFLAWAKKYEKYKDGHGTISEKGYQTLIKELAKFPAVYSLVREFIKDMESGNYDKEFKNRLNIYTSFVVSLMQAIFY